MSKITATTANTNKSVIYSDFFTDFSRHINTGQLNTKTNEDAVKQSIRNLLLTDRYERPFQPEIGCDLQALLFENFTPSTQITAETIVQQCIEKYEPRAILHNVVCAPSIDMNSLAITIQFSIINNSTPDTIEVLIQRTR